MDAAASTAAFSTPPWQSGWVLLLRVQAVAICMVLDVRIHLIFILPSEEHLRVAQLVLDCVLLLLHRAFFPPDKALPAVASRVERRVLRYVLQILHAAKVYLRELPAFLIASRFFELGLGVRTRHLLLLEVVCFGALGVDVAELTLRRHAIPEVLGKVVIRGLVAGELQDLVLPSLIVLV